MSDDVTLEVKGLDQLLKALGARPPSARVGILGGKSLRKKGKPTNALIGAVHEFGSPARGIPQRSFLRVPLADLLNKRLKTEKLLSRETMSEVLKSGSVLPWLKEVAITAEDIVLGAFDTGGYGKWPAWKTRGYSNNAGMLLVDTQQLRNSITSEVKA